MTEKRELVQGEKMFLRGSIQDKCAECPKTEFHFATKCNPEHPVSAEIAMIGASNLDVVVFERIVPYRREKPNGGLIEGEDKFFLFFRCTDSPCLLNHLRSTMMIHWMRAQQQQMDRELDQARLKAFVRMKKEKGKGRRSNKRQRAKTRASNR